MYYIMLPLHSYDKGFMSSALLPNGNGNFCSNKMCDINGASKRILKHNFK